MPLSLSNSSVRSFRRCKRQFYYKYVEGLESRMPAQPLKLGSWMHSLFGAFYKGDNWREEHAHLTKQFALLSLDEREYYGDLPAQGDRLMSAYEYFWRNEHEDWEILHVEERFVVDLDNGDILSFKPDLIVKEKSTGLVLCVDHKNHRTLPDAEFRLTDLQSVIYPWGLRLAGIEVDVFVWNYIRTKDPTIPHVNLDGQLSTRKLDTEFYALYRFLIAHFGSKEAIPNYWRRELKSLQGRSNYFKRTRMVKPPTLINRLIAELDWTTQEIQAWVGFQTEERKEDPWVRTTTRNCEWDCDYYDLCLTELLGNDGAFLKKRKFIPSKYTEELIRIGRK